jgi:ABC-type glycerol-3-phosphate transport system substrate-binding protein
MCVDLLLNLTAISQRAKFNWNVAPMPAVPGGAGAQLVTPITYAIPATSPNPEGAWTFLHFAAGPEGAAAVAKAGQFPMYNTAEVRTAWLNRQPAPPAGTETFFTTNWQMTPRGEDSTTQKYWNALVTLFTQALSGQRPWEDALRDYLLEADRIKLETR